MDNELTAEQEELVAAVRTLLERRAGSQEVRSAMASAEGFDRELWRTLTEEIGAAAIAIGEAYDGIGATVFETHLVLEVLGESLAPSPYLASAAIAAQAILISGDADACTRLLPQIAAGEVIATLAWANADGRWAPSAAGDASTVTASGSAEEWMLNGSAPLVLDGSAADLVLVLAETPDGTGIFEITDSAGVGRTATAALDPTMRFATLSFDAVRARPLSLGDSEVLDRIRNTMLIALTALQVGAAARGLAMTVTYAGQRVQFGRPIGSFQALKHRMADMHVALETARSISRAAARALASNDPDTGRLAAMAKAQCGDALDLIASETIQLHGGIAITWEHDAHLVFKRAHALSQLLGQSLEQRQLLARDFGLTAALGARDELPPVRC